MTDLLTHNFLQNLTTSYALQPQDPSYEYIEAIPKNIVLAAL